MGKLLKIGTPVLGIIALGVFGWIFLEQSGQTENAQKAAGHVYNAADKALTAAFADKSMDGANFVSVGAIYTSTGNLHATLVVRGSEGVDAVCSRIAHVRDFLVVLLSDFPPDPSAPSAGPSGYDGSITDALNELVGTTAVERIRFDPYQQNPVGVRPTC